MIIFAGTRNLIVLDLINALFISTSKFSEIDTVRVQSPPIFFKYKIS